jgi:pilus assembly protein FimV
MTGAGGDWEHVCKLGQELDPANPLYQPGGHPPAPSAQERKPAIPEEMISTMPFTAQPALSQPTMPVDLDLDFSANDRRRPEPKISTKPMGLADPDETLRVPMAREHDTLQDSLREPVAGQATAPMPASASVPLDMDFSSTAPASIEPPAAPSEPAQHSGMLEFDLSSISLDLDRPADAAKPMGAAIHAAEHAESRDIADAPGAAHDPLLTKLELAEEFRTIGDADGARALAEEVIAEASGSLKARAQKLIAELG